MFIFQPSQGHQGDDSCGKDDNRFVANVTYLLKPHVACMLHLHLVFLTAMTQALCYYSWISDDRMEAWGKSEK